MSLKLIIENMKTWNKKSQEEIKEYVFNALNKNVNYNTQNVLGIPASYLNDEVFSQDETFLKEAPFMSSLVKNPNHIGCHTLGNSEGYFSGTQKIEQELIELSAVDILKGKPQEQDGYVASGGTEANIQAIWIYRNYFLSYNYLFPYWRQEHLSSVQLFPFSSWVFFSLVFF